MLWGGTDPSDPWLGRVVAERYRIIEPLGRGGMGRVFLAEQKMGKVSRKVALKALHPDLVSDPAIVARFNREAETVIQLTHPNTITFYDFGRTDDGTLYIVMEYIEGESLARLVERGPMDPSRAEGILAQICGSLQEAHEMGVIHRDLKPENVILTERAAQRDFVKLLDFGIAKRTELDADSLKLTRAGVVLGTPPYMSPEQFAGQRLDRRSDVYSLGVLAYEMVTGELPFTATTPWEWATKHLSHEAPPLPELATLGPIPESYRRAVRRALAKEVGDRPATALEFIDELRGEAGPGRAGARAESDAAPPDGAAPPEPGPEIDRERDTIPSELIIEPRPPPGRRRLWPVLLSLALVLGLVLTVSLIAALVYLEIVPFTW